MCEAQCAWGNDCIQALKFFLLVREDDDASGPSILLRAAAEMIVDEAERDSHIDAAEALLGLIPSVDLETSIIHGHWLLFFRAGRATPSATQICTLLLASHKRLYQDAPRPAPHNNSLTTPSRAHTASNVCS
ncbi:hypothetical protein EMIHUDRAFT_242506 [Emiliania huxleyi CCMP1516]|uniref:Uncharacterized protein n=2 Tax=Emiliania huxleyi TaxID=2903 RepID=A0A0D3J8J2_EMIH1|nr:hypothetical protein EMIHUDRAFT_242506 [Emiliania huxleyi CCMP1516]EOD19827.1 hypothetical protein EMIHUDRAFT_242506 [Emiliania huxleyi CCMP1516]|eukprot:XP_005772256.1 hypothetical protein EMIHUDRAFT_242506 [Emiliania huxleyi CCMP1516]